MARRGKYRYAKLRSGFEDKVKKYLEDNGVGFRYEPYQLHYYLPVKIHRVQLDGTNVDWMDVTEYSFQQLHKYSPDFVLDNGIHIEAKGKFTAKDRKKMVAVKQEHPNIEFVLLFQRDNTLTSASKTRYTAWAKKHGFRCAVDATGKLPKEWMD